MRPVQWCRRDLVRIGWLVAAYVLIRLLGLGLLDAAVHLPRDSPAITPDSPAGAVVVPSTYDKLGAWDGGWYVAIAEHGYPDHLEMTDPHHDDTASLAFPPLYPMLIRVLYLLGMPALGGGLLVTALAGVAAVVGVYAVARELLEPRGALLAALLWAAGPMTIVLAMVYSEALFVALAAWAIWLARRGWWLTAGVLGLLAGLTRSTGLAVGAALVVAWLLARRDGRPGPRAVVGAALGVLGVPLWWLYVAIVSGRVDGWFAAQRFFWGSRFDFGAATAKHGWRTLTFDASLDPLGRVVHAAASFAMLVAVVLLLALLGEALGGRWDAARWWPVAAYAAVLVVLAVGSAGFPQSKIRFLVPMFPLLLLPARRLATGGLAARAGTLVVLAVGGAWFGAFMLTVWPYAI